MGYAKSGQNARGILTRLYSRAFIMAEPNGSNRVVFVSIDIGMVSQRLRLEVSDRGEEETRGLETSLWVNVMGFGSSEFLLPLTLEALGSPAANLTRRMILTFSI